MKTLRPLILLFVFPSVAMAARSYFLGEEYHRHDDVLKPRTAKYYDEVAESKSFYELSFGEWFYGPHALADFRRARATIEDFGIVPDVSYLGNFAANPVGGMRKGATNTSNVNLGLGVYFDKLFQNDALSSWSLGNVWVWRFGDSLSNKYVGNAFNVQQNYGSQTMQLQSLFLQYKGRLSDDLDLLFKIGRIAAADNFMTKPIYWLYMSNGMDGNPKGVFYQTRLSAYPGSTWGAFAQVHNKDGLYFKAGAYQINSDEQNEHSQHGLDWSFKGALGVNANFEAGWDINHDDSGKSPGNISAGYVAEWYSVPHNDNPARHSHYNSVVYIQADYMIFNFGTAPAPEYARYIQRDKNEAYRDLRGIVLWGVVQYAPDDNLAYMPFFANGGLLFNGLVPGRKDDVIALGAAYGKFSGKINAYEKNSHEIVLEANYKLQINRFMFVQPNIQYVMNPRGGQHSSALVLGAQYGVKF